MARFATYGGGLSLLVDSRHGFPALSLSSQTQSANCGGSSQLRLQMFPPFPPRPKLGIACVLSFDCCRSSNVDLSSPSDLASFTSRIWHFASVRILSLASRAAFLLVGTWSVHFTAHGGAPAERERAFEVLRVGSTSGFHFRNSFHSSAENAGSSISPFSCLTPGFVLRFSMSFSRPS